MTLPKTPMRITPSFAFAYVERAIQEGLGRRQFGKLEQAMVLNHFWPDGSAPTCVYCGSPNPARWDHVIPVKLSGETVIGNMVLACAACDDSKQARPFRDWLRARGLSGCEERIRRIEAYMKAYGYSTPLVDSGLTETEAQQLEELRSAASNLRSRIEEFLLQVNARRVNDNPEKPAIL